MIKNCFHPISISVFLLAGSFGVFSQLPDPDGGDRAPIRSNPRIIQAAKDAAIERNREFRRLNPDDVSKYKGLLSSGEGGLFRVSPDFDCAGPPGLRKDPRCVQRVPVNTLYSFRAKAYSNDPFNDIWLNRGLFTSDAFFEQAVFVSLGNIPIENATLTDQAMKFLVDFKPSTTVEDARNAAARLEYGVHAGGYTYANAVKADNESTYAARFIAYRLGSNSYKRTMDDRSLTGRHFYAQYNDKRADIIVVFRIVRRDPDGGLTILWKRLDHKKAPEIRIEKDEPLLDFRRSN